MKYKVPVTIFLLIFVIFGLGELLFGAVFYDKISYWRTTGFGLIAAALVTYMLLKKGNVNKVSDVLKFKKVEISVNKKCSTNSMYLITETLKLNNYIINTKKSSFDKIHFTSKSSLLDVGDIYTIKFLDKSIIIKSRPKIIVNITDTSGITTNRIKQIESIVKQYITS